VPEYMLLPYAPEGDEAERAERWAEMPLWDEVNASLREAGVRVQALASGIIPTAEPGQGWTDPRSDLWRVRTDGPDANARHRA
jgi:hypothetical protein